jgi:hypothetical protein
MNVPLSNILNPPEEIKPKKNSAPEVIQTSNIITTPCEKVLSILQDAKNCIQRNTKGQITLKSNLEWAIEIISSRSLYSYEIKEMEKVNKLSQENPEFKALVDFVSEYNEKVIKMSRKYNSITDKLLLKPSINLNKKKLKRKSSFIKEKPKLLNIFDNQETIKQNNVLLSSTEQKHLLSRNNANINNDLNRTQQHSSKRNNIFNKIENIERISSKKKPRIEHKKKNKQVININNKLENNNNKTININNKNNAYKNQGLDFLKGYFNPNSIDINKKIRKKSDEVRTKYNYTSFPSVQQISITINKNGSIGSTKVKKRFSTIENVDIMNFNHNSNKKGKEKKFSTFRTDKGIPHLSKIYFPFMNIQNRLIQEGLDVSKIINDKNFDIFVLKDLIGYNNVLPFVGRLILENLGLIDEEILSLQKLDSFLISVNSQYKPEVLYHNCLHGADVTQSCYIFFTYTKAEKIAQTNVLDLLSIFIAALGHDIGHPGLTNTFQINDSTDMAITYNDISVLENYHASTLFKTIRKTENNIFEKLTPIDYKIIRKRMVSEILATDMAFHGKVISQIKSKMIFNEDDNTYRLNLLSGDEKTRSDEQQSFLDFMLHLSDLAHNTKLFSISIKWVELLSEEFWKQGDLEKEHKLPISFLCDRENTNVPQSQVGFISGFILSTYECLGNIFPSLRFTYENANNNLKEWQKLANKGRKRGWTPKKGQNNNFVRKRFLKAQTKNYDDFKFKKGKNDKNELNDSIEFIEHEQEQEEENKKIEEKKEEKKEEKVEKIASFNTVKNKKNINMNLAPKTERNRIIKKNFNSINTDINKKNNIVRIPLKLKLSINDDFPVEENKNVTSEFRLLNSKEDKGNVENKMYKYNDKFMCKKSAYKKKNCK